MCYTFMFVKPMLTAYAVCEYYDNIYHERDIANTLVKSNNSLKSNYMAWFEESDVLYIYVCQTDTLVKRYLPQLEGMYLWYVETIKDQGMYHYQVNMIRTHMQQIIPKPINIIKLVCHFSISLLDITCKDVYIKVFCMACHRQVCEQTDLTIACHLFD